MWKWHFTWSPLDISILLTRQPLPVMKTGSKKVQVYEFIYCLVWHYGQPFNGWNKPEKAKKCRCNEEGHEKGCYGGNQLNKYWVEKLERGKKVQNNENKELVIQVIQDLIWEFEQKVEGYVASKQFPTCTDAVSFCFFCLKMIYFFRYKFCP